MTGKELYESFRANAQANGATLHHMGRYPASVSTPHESTELPHWFELKEREKQVWDSTASNLPIPKPKEAVY